jgi:hypothetical protein
MSNQTRDFKFSNTPNNGLIPVIAEKIDRIDKMLCRIEERQAEYHGFTNAGIKNITNTQIELTEILLTQNEALTQIAKALRTIIERGEE